MAGIKGQGYATDLLLLVFNNTVAGTTAAAIGDGLRGTVTAGSLYWAMHTASPGATGSQNTTPVGYTNYVYVAGARSTGGFTVGTATVSPAATVTFATGGAGGSNLTATDFSLGTASSGAGHILYTGAITPNIVTGNTITPTLTTSSAITEA